VILASNGRGPRRGNRGANLAAFGKINRELAHILGAHKKLRASLCRLDSLRLRTHQILGRRSRIRCSLLLCREPKQILQATVDALFLGRRLLDLGRDTLRELEVGLGRHVCRVTSYSPVPPVPPIIFAT
jgi:hypothetical protein